MKSGWLCSLGVVLALGSSGTMARQSPRTVPASLLAAVDYPLAEFIRMIARVTPAGFEMRESDDVAPLRSTAVPEGQSTVALTEVVDAFNRVHRSYHAEIMNGVLVVRPIDRRVTFLDRPSPIREPTTQIGVMRAIRFVLSPLNPRLLDGVVIGSTLGLHAFEGLSRSIALDGSQPRRVIDTLNQVAVQAPGAWQVVTRRVADETEIVQYGFIYTDGARTRSRMPGYIQTQP